jgi:hypothetical protein
LNLAEQEGFTGMIGPTAVNQRNDKEYAELLRLQTEFSQKSSAYANAHKQLMAKATTYITSGSRDKSKNFNMLVTRPAAASELVTTSVGCYNYVPETGLQLQADLGNQVSENTCKIRAADLGYSVFGSRVSSGQCYVGDDASQLKVGGVALQPFTSFKLQQDTGANTAQLLSNGQLGIYDSKNSQNLGPGNLLTELPAVEGCDMFLGGNINVQHASYGYNCNGMANTAKVPTIRYTADTKYCLNQPSGNTSWATQMDLRQCIDTNPSQNFTYDSATKHIKINNKGLPSDHDLCLNVHGADVGKANGARVIQWGCQGPNELNDKWEYDSINKKFVSSLPALPGGVKRCLDVQQSPTSGASGNFLLLNDCTNTAVGNQQFSLFTPTTTPDLAAAPVPAAVPAAASVPAPAPRRQLTVKTVTGPSNFDYMGNNLGALNQPDTSFWRPKTDWANKMYPVGDVLTSDGTNTGDYYKLNPNNPIQSVVVGGDVVNPISYRALNPFNNLTGKQMLWQQVATCPDGYRALGDMATTAFTLPDHAWGLPPDNQLKCVPKDCLKVVQPFPQQNITNAWDGGGIGHYKLADPTVPAYNYNFFREIGSDFFYDFYDNPKCQINRI